MNVQVWVEWTDSKNKYKISLKAFLKQMDIDATDDEIKKTVRRLASKDELQAE